MTMSIPPKSQAEDDKVSLLSLEPEASASDEVTSIGLAAKSAETKYEGALNGFLHAPLSGPVRPLSPDTLSVFSTDEYEQIRPTRSRQRHQDDRRLSSRSPAPPRGWRAKIEASWLRNKGLFYMLCAQIFGTLMNVTTRLLEIEGNKGNGLHPFQILFARMGITLVLASGYMWWRKTPHFPFGVPEIRWLLVARGFCGFFGVFGMYCELSLPLHVPPETHLKHRLSDVPPSRRCNRHYVPCAESCMLGLLDLDQGTFHTHGADGCHDFTSGSRTHS